jgi:hypothetical protein
MDDRILLVPPTWSPDPGVLESWPSPQALLRRLRSSYPVDILRWPSLKGEKRVGSGWEPAVNAFARRCAANITSSISPVLAGCHS